MAILGYQVLIAMVIIVSTGVKGRQGLWIATILASAWTLTHVFMPWLAILQVITIAVAHGIASDMCPKAVKGKE